MQQETLDNQSNQNGRSIHSIECNICSQTFSTSHGRNIHLSSCRKRYLSSKQRCHKKQYNRRQWVNTTKISKNSQQQQVVYWRRNLFKLPSGAAGKKLVPETTKWIEYRKADATYHEHIALKVVMIMHTLLLLKSSFKSTSKQHSQFLKRRLQLWELADLNKLCYECSIIQAKLPTNRMRMNGGNLFKTFAKFVLEGKIKQL